MTQRLNRKEARSTLDQAHSVRIRPTVFERDQQVVLRFDSRADQSAMYKKAPFRLALSYTRQMMGFLLLHPEPRDILIIGLGGGSLSKYCYQYLPECRVTTVEISDRVIALRETFAIPPDDDRFEIVHADGADYIAACRDRFDAILLDGFDGDGLPSRLCSQNFYKRCAVALKKSGILVANLLEGDWSIGTCVNRIGTVFDDQVLGARSERGFNLIIYAINQAPAPDSEELRLRALGLGMETYDLDFQAMAYRIRSGIEPPWAYGL